MSLINLTPQTQTTADIQAALKNNVSQQLSTNFSNLAYIIKSLFDLMWANQQLTPQQCFDAFSTDAASLVDMFHGAESFINTIQPNTLNLVEPNQLTKNSDGTVTVIPNETQ